MNIIEKLCELCEHDSETLERIGRGSSTDCKQHIARLIGTLSVVLSSSDHRIRSVYCALASIEADIPVKVKRFVAGTKYVSMDGVNKTIRTVEELELIKADESKEQYSLIESYGKPDGKVFKTAKEAWNHHINEAKRECDKWENEIAGDQRKLNNYLAELSEVKAMAKEDLRRYA